MGWPDRLKKNHKPAKVVLDCSTQRRLTVKVHTDQKKAKVDAVAAEAAAVAHHQSQLDRVAALEDAMEAEDTTRSLEDLRPDLHIGHKSASSTDGNALSDSPPMLDDPVAMPHNMQIDFPPEGSSYRESSHGEEYMTSWEEFEDHVVTAKKNTEDQDYVLQTGNESEAWEDEPQIRKSGMAPKAKKKPPKVRFSFLVR